MFSYLTIYNNFKRRRYGNRVKSNRNRIVPVPEYIGKELARGDINNNIFTHTSKPYNNSYFKGVWRRFKRHFPSVEQGKLFTLLDTQGL